VSDNKRNGRWLPAFWAMGSPVPADQVAFRTDFTQSITPLLQHVDPDIFIAYFSNIYIYFWILIAFRHLYCLFCNIYIFIFRFFSSILLFCLMFNVMHHFPKAHSLFAKTKAIKFQILKCEQCAAHNIPRPTLKKPRGSTWNVAWSGGEKLSSACRTASRLTRASPTAPYKCANQLRFV